MGQPVRQRVCSSGRREVPATAGIGLRSVHAREILDGAGVPGWLEVHSENFFSAGGPHIDSLRALRARYPISAHGVGLSLGSADGPCTAHLARLARLCEWLEPALVSEHLSWGAVDGRHSNDLLPLPCTEEALTHFVAAVDRTQSFLRRQILIENVSSYLQYGESTMPEWEFLVEVARRSGCALLVDVNNIEVNAINHGFDARTYLDAIPAGYVAELHVAGHTRQVFPTRDWIVDTHDREVAESTWALLQHALVRFGPVPVLVEWDVDLPPLATLLAEAGRADECLENCRADAA